MGTRILDGYERSQGWTQVLNPGWILDRIRQNSTTKLRAIQVCLMIIDILLIEFAFWAAYNVRFEGITSALFDIGGAQDIEFYHTTMYMLAPLWIVLFYISVFVQLHVVFVTRQDKQRLWNFNKHYKGACKAIQAKQKTCKDV